jgi:hypothetical protein
MAEVDFLTPDWRTPIHPDNDKEFVEFLGVSNVQNFCFMNIEVLRKFDVRQWNGDDIITGSWAMGSCIRRAVDIPPDGRDLYFLDTHYNLYNWYILADIKDLDIGIIFRPETTVIPLIEQRAALWRNFGETMINREYKKFFDFIEDCDFRAFCGGKGIVERLIWEFECYKDISKWRRHNLFFAKRAMLTAMMYYDRAKSSSVLPDLKDPESLGPISDYVVPRTLRGMDILQYSDDLAYLVDHQGVLPRDSDYEIAIRAKTVEAMVLLLDSINERREHNRLPAVTMSELDYYMWETEAGKYRDQKHHLTLTTAY